MAKADGPTELGSLISTLVASKSWQSRIRLHQVFTFWDDVVGRDVARHAQPQVIRGTVLWVGVCDSIWMQQLQYERQYLLEAINARLDDGDSDDGAKSGLRLTELRLALDPTLINSKKDQTNLSTSALEVDQEQLAAFTRMLSSIMDQGLKQSMIRVWLVMHRRDRVR